MHIGYILMGAIVVCLVMAAWSIFKSISDLNRKTPKFPPRPTPSRSPSIKPIEENTIALWFKGQSTQAIIQEMAFLIYYLGEEKMDIEIDQPGDGTIRIAFDNVSDMITFKLYWADKLLELAIPDELLNPPITRMHGQYAIK